MPKIENDVPPNPFFGSDWYKGSSHNPRWPEVKVMATSALRRHAAEARRTAKYFDEEIHRRGLSAEIDDE
jgi:hypothetical protein